MPALVHVRQKAQAAASDDLSSSLLAIADLLEPELARAFLTAVQETRSRINYDDLAQAIEDGDLTAAEVASQIDFLETRLQEDVPEIVRRAFVQAAEVVADELDSALQVGFKFDLTNSQAIEYAGHKAAEKLTESTNETKEGIRDILKRSLGGEVGRVEPVIKEIQDQIGLRTDQMEAVRNYRDQLVTDGAEPLDAELKATKYAHDLLKDRAQLIARTEIIDSLNAGAMASWGQAIRDGWIDQDQMELEWVATPDERTCPICDELDGQRVAFGESFDSKELGEPIDQPGAHPNCRCTLAMVPLTADEIQAAQDQAQDDQAEPLAAFSRVPVVKFNPNHEPAGSPEGGQFAESGGSAASDRAFVQSLHDENFSHQGEAFILDGLTYGDEGLGSLLGQPFQDTTHLDDATRGKIKDSIVKDLAPRLQQQGVTPEQARAFFAESQAPYSRMRYDDPYQNAVQAYLDLWMRTSGDGYPPALAIQAQAQRMFDLTDGRRPIDEDQQHHAEEFRQYHEKILGALLTATYEATQARLKAAGIEELTLYRGQTYRAPAQRDGEEGLPPLPSGLQLATIKLQPLSSFSSSLHTAEIFAYDHMDHMDPSMVMAIRVPRAAIFATARTGQGAASEGEFIVMGRKEGYRAAYFVPAYNHRHDVRFTDVVHDWLKPTP